MISRLLATRPRLEGLFLSLDKNWAKLPAIAMSSMFTDFDSQEIRLRELPSGPWSSPVGDIVVLAKLVACQRPQRLLEVGSFRGYTTKVLATHARDDARIVALDRDPRHGSAYEGTPAANLIERRIGDVSQASFAGDRPGSYDFIFLDADHCYDAVKRDTEIVLPLLAEDGLIVWHDYANWGRFSGRNGVPRYLHELSRTHAIAAVSGTWLAIHCPAWNATRGLADRFRDATEAARLANESDVWSTSSLRG